MTMNEPLEQWHPKDTRQKRLRKALLRKFQPNDTWQTVYDWCAEITPPPYGKSTRVRSYQHEMLDREFNGLGLQLVRALDLPGIGFGCLIQLTKQLTLRGAEEKS